MKTFREKKREREREELWKRLHDLENSRSPSSNSDKNQLTTQTIQDNSISSSPNSQLNPNLSSITSASTNSGKNSN